MSMKLSKILLPLFVATLLAYPYSFAQAVPAPQQVAFMYQASGSSADGYSLKLAINGNPGIISTDSSGNSGLINPLAFTPDQLASAAINLNISYPNILEFWEPSIRTCSLDAYNSSGGTGISNNVTPQSGSQTLSLGASLIPGNWSVGVGCTLSNGDKINDFLYIYVTEYSPPPVENTFMYNGSIYGTGINGQYQIRFNINGNPGLETIHGGSPSGSTGLISPIALTSSQLSSATLQLAVSYPSGILGTGLVIPIPGIPALDSCTFSASKLNNGSFKSFYKQTITATPIETQNLTLPVSLNSGNYDIGVTCSLSNGATLADFDYVYVMAPNVQIPCSGSQTPSVTMKASPICVASGQTTTISWTTANVTSCVDNNGESYSVPTGSFIDSPSGQRTYTLLCNGSCGEVTGNTTVNGSSCAVPPVGKVDGVNSTICNIYGWTYDPSNPSQSTNIYVYRDGGNSSGGALVGEFPANQSSQTIDSAYGITGNHGFAASLSPYIADGQNHSLYVYGIDADGYTTALLSNSPGSIQCTAPSGSSPGSGGSPPSVDIKIY